MTRDEFLTTFKDILQTDADINFDTKLSDIEEWDSLASISILAFFKQKMNLKIDAQALKNSKTIGDILKLAGK